MIVGSRHGSCAARTRIKTLPHPSTSCWILPFSLHEAKGRTVHAASDEMWRHRDGVRPAARFRGRGGGAVGYPALGADTMGRRIRTSVPPLHLDENETYIVGIRDRDYEGTANLNDVNGTRVTSNRPVAVVSGVWLQGEGNGTGQDIGVDQLVPTGAAGTEYVLVKGNAANGVVPLAISSVSITPIRPKVTLPSCSAPPTILAAASSGRSTSPWSTANSTPISTRFAIPMTIRWPTTFHRTPSAACPSIPAAPWPERNFCPTTTTAAAS